MSEPFFHQADHIDDFVKGGPRSLEPIEPYLANPQLQAYFFSKTGNAAWLDHMVAAKLYNFAALSKEEERLVWSRFEYLLKIAPEQQELIQKIIETLSDGVLLNNFPVISEILEKLPPSTTVALVPRFKEVIGGAEWIPSADTLGRIIVHVSRISYVNDGLELLGSILELQPDATRDTDTHLPLPPTPRAKLDSWDYQELLEATLPTLFERDPLAVFKFLCDLLEHAVRRSTNEPDKLDDHSTGWKETVESSLGEYDSGPRENLVAAVRDRAIDLRFTNRATLPEIVNDLEGRRWPIFRRIALYVLAKTHDHLELVETRLLAPNNFDAREIRPEYNLLLKTRFRELRPPSRNKLLDLIDEGPDTQGYASYLDMVAKDLSASDRAADIERFVRDWKRRFLRLIRSDLNTDEYERFSGILAEITERDPYTARPTIAQDVGPRSAKSAEELKAMTHLALIHYLQDEYVPSPEFMGHSPIGLGRELQAAVSEVPEHFGKEAALFANLEINPTFHASLFRGFRDALKAGRSVPWPNVIGLATWLVAQRDQDAHKYGGPIDQERHGFRSARLVLADLLTIGFASDNPHPIPRAFHGEVWGVLEHLTSDLDPEFSREYEYFDNWISVAINAVRTEALAATINYAFWLRQPEQIEDLGSEPETFNSVWEVLEKHLNTNQDPSLAVRSVYGRFLPWLESLDPAWVRDRLDQLFPKDQALEAWYRACWETYLLSNAPYDRMYGVLEAEYIRAIRLLKGDVSTNGVNPETRLVEHVFLYYVRGLIDLPQADNALELFYKHASLPLRSFVLEFLGRVLRNADIPDLAFTERLMALVDDRLNSVTDPSEFKSFGYWLDARALPDDWKLATLRRLLPKVDMLEPLRLVLGTLERLVRDQPAATLDCLEAVAEKGLMTRNVVRLRDPVQKVLTVLVVNPDADIQQRAISLAHHFGSLGLWNLRSLTKG